MELQEFGLYLPQLIDLKHASLEMVGSSLTTYI